MQQMQPGMQQMQPMQMQMQPMQMQMQPMQVQQPIAVMQPTPAEKKKKKKKGSKSSSSSDKINQAENAKEIKKFCKSGAKALACYIGGPVILCFIIIIVIAIAAGGSSVTVSADECPLGGSKACTDD